MTFLILQIKLILLIYNNYRYKLYITFQEAKAFSDRHKWNLDSIEDIAKKMSTLNVQHIGQRLVIITQGEKPIFVAKSNILYYINQYQ